MRKLGDQEISSMLEQLNGWTLESKKTLKKSFKWKDFKEAMFFVNAIAFVAEKMNHHPDLGMSWNRVDIGLTTHDVGGVTELDFELAKEIDSLSSGRD